jgi:hypothetical protein
MNDLRDLCYTECECHEESGEQNPVRGTEKRVCSGSFSIHGRRRAIAVSGGVFVAVAVAIVIGVTVTVTAVAVGK